jgi:hypothetical protein
MQALLAITLKKTDNKGTPKKYFKKIILSLPKSDYNKWLPSYIEVTLSI